MKAVKYLSFFMLGLLLIAACEEDRMKTLPVIPEQASFINTTSGAFFVQDLAKPVFQIEVGATTVSASDRTVNFTIDPASTAKEGTHFKLGATSVTIPANSTIGTIDVEGIYANLTADPLSLMIKLSAGGIDTAAYDLSYSLTLQQYCPYIADDFVGTWEASDFSDYDGEYAPYQLTVEKGVGDTLIIIGLWEDDTPVKMVMDATDPTNFSATIPDQYYATHPSYGEMRISEMAPGFFSACNQTISTSYEIYVSAGFFDKVSSSEWKKVTAKTLPIGSKSKTPILR